MKLATVPARDGTLWVRQGFQTFFRWPMGYAGLFAAYLLGVFLLVQLPVAGALLMLAFLPLVSLGFMVATRGALEGRGPSPKSFVAPLRTGRPRFVALAQLGLVYALASFFIMWLADRIDGGALDSLMETMSSGNAPPEQMAQKLYGDPRLLTGLVVRLGLAALLSMPFWHAPALVHWGAQNCTKALFFSTVACWRNRGAFVVYGLAWAAVVAGFGVLTSIVFALLGALQLVVIAATPASLLFSTVFYVSLYFTYAACFVDDVPAVQAA